MAIQVRQAFLFLLIFATAGASNAQGNNGLPFQDLQNQIDDLQQQINDLQTGNSGPVEVDLDCTEESISNTLETYKASPGVLTINVSGICTENITINRNNVLLRGMPATIKAQTFELPAMYIEGYNGIYIENLNIIGATYPNSKEGIGIQAWSGANLFIRHSSLIGFSIGLNSQRGASVEISESTVTDNSIGMQSRNNAVLSLADMQIINNESVGVHVSLNGHVSFINDSIGISNISGNREGFRIQRHGYALLRRLNIENNSADGIRVRRFGILSVLNEVQVKNNSRWGISCDNEFEIDDLFAITFENNQSGDIEPECLE